MFSQRRGAEKKQMELKYKEITRDDMRLAENIESVKEVTLTCERKIKEFKVTQNRVRGSHHSH